LKKSVAVLASDNRLVFFAQDQVITWTQAAVSMRRK
jgi:hypothetical protein